MEGEKSWRSFLNWKHWRRLWWAVSETILLLNTDGPIKSLFSHISDRQSTGDNTDFRRSWKLHPATQLVLFWKQFYFNVSWNKFIANGCVSKIMSHFWQIQQMIQMAAKLPCLAMSESASLSRTQNRFVPRALQKLMCNSGWGLQNSAAFRLTCEHSRPNTGNTAWFMPKSKTFTRPGHWGSKII